MIENTNELAAAVDTLAAVPQVPGVPGNLDAVAVIGVMIPIVAIVLGIGIGMLALWLDYRKKREFFELHHKERMAAIEKGMEVPPLPAEFFQDRRRNRTPADDLRRGLVLLLVGVAITIALYQRAGANGLWGLVPAAVGLAYLLSYFISGRRSDDAADQNHRDRSNH